MTLSDLSSISSVISGIAVLVSLVYLARQMRQNAIQMQMAEMNAAQSRFTQHRLAIANHRDVAQLWAAGMADGPLDDVDEIRFRSLLSDYTWSIFHTWERDRRVGASGDIPSPVPFLATLLTSKRGRALREGFRPGFPVRFGKTVDEAIAATSSTPAVAQQ